MFKIQTERGYIIEARASAVGETTITINGRYYTTFYGNHHDFPIKLSQIHAQEATMTAQKKYQERQLLDTSIMTDQPTLTDFIQGPLHFPTETKNPLLGNLSKSDELINVAKAVLSYTEIRRRHNGRGKSATYNADIDTIAQSARQLAEMVLEQMN